MKTLDFLVEAPTARLDQIVARAHAEVSRRRARLTRAALFTQRLLAKLGRAIGFGDATATRRR